MRTTGNCLEAVGLGPQTSSRRGTVDATVLDCIDHRALLLLQRRLQASDASAHLLRRSAVVVELIGLLALDRIDAGVVR